MRCLMNKIDKKSLIPLGSVTAVVFLIDQASKYIVSARMELGQTFPLLPGFFHLTLVKNPGAAFGILPYQTYFFLIITVIAVLLLILFALFLPVKLYSLKISLALLAGGALGNFFDRLRTGYVIDFLDFRIWPVFNLADMTIMLGLLIFLFNIRHVK